MPAAPLSPSTRGLLGPGVTHVHMVGIGGAGMEPLARLLVQAGYRVTGSDAADGAAVASLRNAGITVWVGHAAAQVRGADLLVTSAAVGPDNPERRAAAAAGIPQRRRAEVLGAFSRAQPTVAVAGTHGKTTTSSLVAAAAIAGGRCPDVAVGGWVGGRTQGGPGGGGLLVAEADEYDRSFLELTPWIAVVTNIETEHVDCYADEDAVVAAFAAFLGRTRGDGTVVVNGDDPLCAAAAAALSVPVVTFGFGPACQVRAEAVAVVGDGTEFDLVAAGRRRLRLRLPGRHNVANALAAWAACRALGLDAATTGAALEAFAGVDRRFQTRRTAAGVTVVDDYAHHPTELAATLAAVRERAGAGRVVAVFQPHTYSRTRHFAAAFAAALAAADACWVTAVYAARETPDAGAEADVVVAALQARGAAVRWAPQVDAALRQGLADCRPGDWLVAMGAGDIGQHLAALVATTGPGAAR